MKRLNFKSDFDFILRLQSCNCVDIGFPDCDWVARFWTSSRSMVYEASCIGGVCQNCYNDSGQIHIVMDNHGLGIGELQCEFTMLTAEEQFSDGTRKTVSVLPIDIELVRGGCACPVSAEAVAMIPALKGEKGDTGEKGDSFEFADLSEEQIAELAQPALEVANDIRNGLEESIEAVDARVDETNQALAQAQEEQSVINERVKHEYVGVWDELDHIKEILASVATHEVHDLLSSMGYEEEDIEDYLYFNLHGFISVSMDELRLSAHQWMLRDNLSKPLEMPVMPMWQDEWNTNNNNYGTNSIYTLFTGRIKYCPLFKYVSSQIARFTDIEFVNKIDGNRNHIHFDTKVNSTFSKMSAVYNFTNVSGIYTNITNKKFPNPHIIDAQGNFVLEGDLFHDDNKQIHFNKINLDFSSLTEIRNRVFYNKTLYNLNLENVNCDNSNSFAYSALNGCNIHLKNAANPWNFNSIFEGIALENTHISLSTNSSDGQVGRLDDYSHFIIGGKYDEPSSIEVPSANEFYLCSFGNDGNNGEQTPLIASIKNLSKMNIDNMDARNVDEYETVYVARSGKRPSVFLKDIGFNPKLNSISVHTMFSMHGRPDHPNIRIFVECAKTWTNRIELGLGTVHLEMTPLMIAGMSEEEIASLNEKGYSIFICPLYT